MSGPATPTNPSADPNTPQPAKQARSPVFEALHQPRYYRQQLIREIEEATGRRLIVYFANIANPASAISALDVAPFQDLLLDCQNDDQVDLLLQTPGGDADAAEKLVVMTRARAAAFRLVVTDRAKSAGTLIALASDAILMSATSELGPIDPQVTINQPDGRTMTRPAQSFLDGLDQIKRDVTANGGQLNPAYFPLLQQLDPALLDYCEKVKKRAEGFAQKWLKAHMLKADHPTAEAIASQLANVKQYSSHGMVIDHREAQNLGLNVEYQDPDSALWGCLWKLHASYDMMCRGSNVAKIMESRRVSLLL
jgi:ATP-dependent protease ClpP protease subunit